MTITINAYIESLINTEGRLRSLKQLYPITDSSGSPIFCIKSERVGFSVNYNNEEWVLYCPLTDKHSNFEVDSDYIINTNNRNSTFIAKCRYLKNELLIFDQHGRQSWVDVVMCHTPKGMPLPRFIRTNLLSSDKKPLRSLLGSISAMAYSFQKDDIIHGALKVENITVKDDYSIVAKDFAIVANPSRKNDLLRLSLSAILIYIFGCEPSTYSLLGGSGAFTLVEIQRHLRFIKAQAEFLKNDHLSLLINVIDRKTEEGKDTNEDIDSDKINDAIFKLANEPFVPMPLLMNLIASQPTADSEVVIERPTNLMPSSDTLPEQTEDKTLFVDFEQCEFVSDISDTLIRYCCKGVWGFADRAGKKVKVDNLLYADDFYEGRAKVETTEGCGLIDREGGYVMLSKFEMLEWHGRENVVTAAIDGCWELYDRNGKQLTCGRFDWLGDGNEGFFIARRGDKYAYISSTGRQITDFRFDEAFSFQNGKATVRSGDSTFLINQSGQKTTSL